MSRLLVMVTVLLPSALLAACQASMPERALQVSQQTLQHRQLQTRRFDDIDEVDLLAACAGVLQDLGFNLDESEAELGLIVASKRRTADEAAVTRLMQLLDLLADIEIPVDREQRIRASLVTWPDPDRENTHFVRVTFQRVVWNTEGEISRRESLNEPQLYRQFFEQLSKSVFLEAHSI